ncbi:MULTISPECIES: zinc metallochaperone AztD [unclassified Rhodococcus (in: high G+C Gram-positive bacteria)]|uniref:zinc metallochaperone AztD n=1 Tax=unclassified Rhodococcus (in: high G+C Gram-positive bacteria) TaxID=192944 RepID=UPI001596071E|nr:MULTISPECIES: zinc metallochaperone AztD [unclassified Rhodococcus (in: high G+C Gram-positive bacteria)]
MRINDFRRASVTALALGAVATLAACSSGTTPAAESVAIAAGPRVAVSYEGGLRVLDADTFETVADFDSEEYTRLNLAGDDRNVMVTTSEGFRVLDTAAGTTEQPQLTDTVFEAEKPGHVVRHGGKTILYADGTSDTTIFDTAALESADGLPETESIPGVDAHHGVSIVLEDSTFLTTVGNSNGRTGIEVRDASGAVVAKNDQCPGVHGEGTAEGEIVVFGCENGALIYDKGQITKLDAPDQPYGRTGNAYVSETSPLIVGDYKDDPDAEGSLLHAVTVIDPAAKTLDVVKLPDGAEYTWRGVARGPGDLAYIIGSDGAVHVFDPTTKTFTASYPVIDAWEGPAKYQDAHPGISIAGDTAYVTEPAGNSIHAVDLSTGNVTESKQLDVTPNEFVVVTA